MNKKRFILAATVITSASLLFAGPLYAANGSDDGWQKEKNNWYYYQADKKVEDNWVYHEDNWYYLGNSGAMVTGWQEWQGQWYYLNSPNGDMAACEVTPDGYRVDRSGAWIKEKYDGLKQNEYADLAMNVSLSGNFTAGETAGLTITLKNNGQQTIVYTRGSGSFVTPQALLVRATGLQPIMPKDHLGPATMDYRRDTLAPGQEVTYNMLVRLIQPSSEFDQYSYRMRDEYIGDISWQSLKAAHPDLQQAEAGTYQGQVYFLYSLVKEDSGQMVFGEDTGYITADFEIEVQ